MAAPDKSAEDYILSRNFHASARHVPQGHPSLTCPAPKLTSPSHHQTLPPELGLEHLCRLPAPPFHPHSSHRSPDRRHRRRQCVSTIHISDPKALAILPPATIPGPLQIMTPILKTAAAGSSSSPGNSPPPASSTASTSHPPNSPPRNISPAISPYTSPTPLRNHWRSCSASTT